MAALPSVFLSGIRESSSQLSTDHHGRNERGKPLFRFCVRDRWPSDRCRGDSRLTVTAPLQVSDLQLQARQHGQVLVLQEGDPSVHTGHLLLQPACLHGCGGDPLPVLPLLTFISRFFPTALRKMSDGPTFCREWIKTSQKTFNFWIENHWCSAAASAYLNAETARSS